MRLGRTFKVMARQYPRGREDHYLPQGYLRGFIDPLTPKTDSKPLWVFDVQRGSWRKRSTSQIGWEPGYYDFVGRQGDREHAEEAFAELENGYPLLIHNLRATGFQDWRRHSNFLLRYLQMIRCRSPLFREQFMREWGAKVGTRVIGTEGVNKLQVDSLKLRRFSPGALKEAAITRMLGEMKRGTAMLESFHWQLRLADSVDDSFVTSDQPLLGWAIQGESFDHRSTLMMFPLCWEACLTGRRDPFSLNFHHTTRHERLSIRRTYFESAQIFVVSRQRLF